MAEKTSPPRKPHIGMVPDETRKHFQAAREEFQKSMEGILPPGFLEHHRNARKEMLLAWRSMIDASLDRLEKEK